MMPTRKQPCRWIRDVLEKARAVAGQLRVPFKTVVNEALCIGLSEVEKPAKKNGIDCGNAELYTAFFGRGCPTAGLIWANW
jgi:hypothetical protein